MLSKYLYEVYGVFPEMLSDIFVIMQNVSPPNQRIHKKLNAIYLKRLMKENQLTLKYVLKQI